MCNYHPFIAMTIREKVAQICESFATAGEWGFENTDISEDCYKVYLSEIVSTKQHFQKKYVVTQIYY